MRYFVFKLGKATHLVPESNVAEITLDNPDSAKDPPVKVLLQQPRGRTFGIESVEALRESLVELTDYLKVFRP